MCSGFTYSTTPVNMLLFKHFTILADFVPSGYTRNFSYCPKITNLEKYPDYLLFVHINSEGIRYSSDKYVLLKTGECVPVSGLGWRRTVVKIAAISKDKVKSDDLKNSSLGTSLQNTNLQNALIQGTPTIEIPRQVPLFYEGKQIEVSFKINFITPMGLQLSLVNPSTNPLVNRSIHQSPQVLNWIVFPLIGAVILGWMIWRRKKQMGSSK